jgi:Ser/Thr protein kinase RdoA (MazF antagonist)
MSTYITINDDEARDLLRDFQSTCAQDLGEFQSIEEIGEGYSNSVFRMRTTSGTYVCKSMESPIDGLADTSAERKHLIHASCYSRRMRVPEPLGSLVEVKGRKAQLMRHVDGINLSRIRPWQARVLGKRTAEFQLGLQDIAGLCPRRRANPAKLLVGEVLASARRLNGPRKSGEVPYLATLFDLSMAFLRTRHHLESKRVPRGITHADLNKGNILFTPDCTDIAAFLDFDSVATGFLMRDLVKLIYEFGITINYYNYIFIDKDVTISLIEGYSAARPLSRAELESIEAVLDMTSRWQTASHQKLQLVGRNREDAAVIDRKASLIRSSRHNITKWLREIRLL